MGGSNYLMLRGELVSSPGDVGLVMGSRAASDLPQAMVLLRKHRLAFLKMLTCKAWQPRVRTVGQQSIPLSGRSCR